MATIAKGKTFITFTNIRKGDSFELLTLEEVQSIDPQHSDSYEKMAKMDKVIGFAKNSVGNRNFKMFSHITSDEAEV